MIRQREFRVLCVSGTDGVLYCVGELIAGVAVHVLRDLILSAESTDVWADFSGVEKIDAAGVGTLVELHLFALRCGKVLHMQGFRHCARYLLNLTRLDTVFQIHDRPAATESRVVLREDLRSISRCAC